MSVFFIFLVLPPANVIVIVIIESVNLRSVSFQKIKSGKLPFKFEPPTSAGNKCTELLKSMLRMDPMKSISMKVCDRSAGSALDI